MNFVFASQTMECKDNLCRMVWVMDSYYELDRRSIVEKISNLYQTPGINVINGDVLPEALGSYLEKNVDFTDAVTGASAIRNTKNHTS